MRRISLVLACFFLASSTLADSVLVWDSICTGTKLRWKKVDFSMAGLIPRKDGEIRIDLWAGQPVKRPGTAEWEFEAQAPGCPNLATRGRLEIPKGGTGASEILLAFPSGCKADMSFTLDIALTGKKVFERNPVNPVIGLKMSWIPLEPPGCGNGVIEPPERCDSDVVPCSELGFESDPDEFYESQATCLPTCDGYDAWDCHRIIF